MKLSVSRACARLSIAVVLLGTPVLAVADDLESLFQQLKDAEGKNDAAAVKKLGAETCKLAREAAAEPAPQEADAKEGWTSRIKYAKDVENYTEYALFSVAVKSQPAVAVDLLNTLEQQSPKSKYLDEGYSNYLYVLSQSGATPKTIQAVAEKGLANFPENEDLLAYLADSAYAGKSADKALNYANRLVAVLGRHAKPEGMSQADWDKKRSQELSVGYWISGVVSGEKNQYAAADKNLRAALPYVKGNEAKTAAALFYLGVANYNLGKMTMNKAKVLEGANFSDQCAKLPGQFAEQAYRNALIMKTEAGKMR